VRRFPLQQRFPLRQSHDQFGPLLQALGDQFLMLRLLQTSNKHRYMGVESREMLSAKKPRTPFSRMLNTNCLDFFKELPRFLVRLVAGFVVDLGLLLGRITVRNDQLWARCRNSTQAIQRNGFLD
jgi:hypothetical protein